MAQATAERAFGLLSYRTANIGDEIQSVAARQFLPRVDHYLDRDALPEELAKVPGAVDAILNGWWMWGTAWPPPPNLTPLLVSMYFEVSDVAVRERVESAESREFFATFGPVGARDVSTHEYLQSIGVDSYFSGCMTLTLQRDPSVPRHDFVLAVDLGPDQLRELRRQTTRPVLELSVAHDPDMTVDRRFALAELFLYFYQSASSVVTSRLHSVLPSLALGTPALLVTNGGTYQHHRFRGLEELVHSVVAEDFGDALAWFSPDDAVANPEKHLKLRRDLIERCLTFSGQDDVRAPLVSARLPGLSDPTVLLDLLSDQLSKAHDGYVYRVGQEAHPWTVLGRTARRVVPDRILHRAAAAFRRTGWS
ncbi:polysaccharide pyruvyl transferase family protein [Agromyces sp. SYSU T00266]|uniref:polysaccharide pyruvyl transferase family protein n=1 Tax=Agromyces zhanjiangensis TaxID=3158562 RepID=UPI0033952A83